jgi:hypothetical protein
MYNPEYFKTLLLETLACVFETVGNLTPFIETVSFCDKILIEPLPGDGLWILNSIDEVAENDCI